MPLVLVGSLAVLMHAAIVNHPADDEPAPATQQIDYQKAADASQWIWIWNDDETSPFFCMTGPYGSHDYDVTITQPSRLKPGWKPLKITFSKDGVEKYSFDGHQYSVFGISGDLLYYPVFHYSGSGCQLRCVDLTTGEARWTTPLHGIGIVQHSLYLNRITLRVGKEAIRVVGNESMGQYIEFVDATTGEILGHRVFKDAIVDPRLVAITHTNDAIRKAVSNRDVEFLRRAAALGVDLCRTFPEGDWLLPHAASVRDPATIQLLVDSGCDVNATWERGPTPVFAAIDTTYDQKSLDAAVQCMQILLEHGANPSLADWRGVTPLVRAVQKNSLDAVALLLDHHAALNDGNNNCEALKFAVQYGFEDMVRLLIDRGANVNTLNYDKKSLIHEAERIKKPVIAQMLRDAGARE